MKKKVILSSIMTIALCLCLIAGSTYALFTSQSQTDISVKAAKVEMTAYLSDLKLQSVKADPSGTITDEFGGTYSYVDCEKNTFVNGGTATLDNAVLTLDRVTPGDKVSFNVQGTNTSDVTIQYRYIVECIDGLDSLIDGLIVSVNGVAYSSLKSLTSTWMTLEPGQNIAAIPVVVDFPVTAGNKYQNKSAQIRVVVEAVQGNAAISDDSEIDLAVSTPEMLAKILTSDLKNIAVTLANDIEVPMSALGNQTPGSGEYKLGSEKTETIDIDLNGYELCIKTSYMSAIGAKNDDAVITIKNGTLNSTGNKANTWNIYDFTLSNCNYVLDNVTFAKSVALCNPGKTTTMKNVTINEAQNLYALWISAEGQNVVIDGLTVNSGRGIKIDEQYVAADEVAKVTLSVSNAKFNTGAKAAILVKSIKGADIVLDNVDIANTPDPVHAVWVDEDSKDYIDLVTVTGGAKYYEGDVVSSSAALDELIANGETYIVLAPGSYSMPTTSSDVTIVGSRDTVITINKPKANKVTLQGVTVVGSGNYTGIQHSDTVVYENCLIKGVQFLYANKVIFNNCTFDLTEKADYIWTYDAKNVEFNNCTFNTAGKAILIYAEGASLVTNVSVKGCTFNATASALAGGNVAAAIEIDSSLSKNGHYTLVTENNTVDSDFCGEWRIKKSGSNNTTVNGTVYNAVTIDGKVVAYTAAELQKVLEAATDGLTVYLAKDIEGYVTAPQKAGVKVTIEGNGHTIAGAITVDGKSARYETAGLTIQNVNFAADSLSVAAYINLGKSGDDSTRYTNNVTVKNCTFSYSGVGDVAAVKSYTGGDWNLTVEGCTVNTGMHSALQLANVEKGLKVVDCEVYSKNGINLNYTPSLEMSGCTIDVQGYAVRFGVNGTTNNGTFSIANSTLTSANDDGDAVIILRGTMTGATLTLTNTTLTGTPEITGNANVIR